MPVYLIPLYVSFICAIGASAQQSPTQLKPVPTQTDRKKSREMIAPLFDLETTNSSAQRKAVSKKLVQTAMDTTGDDVSRFELLNLAQELVAKAGDIATAFEIIETLSSEYAFDPDLVRISALKQAASNNELSPDARLEVTGAIHDMVDQFVQDDRYDRALALLIMVIDRAKKWRDRRVVSVFSRRHAHTTFLKKEFPKVKSAIAELKNDASNTKANLTVGKFYAFRKGDWATGMPYLSNCGNALITKLAKLEMKGAADAKTMVQLADGWSELAESYYLDSMISEQILARSLAWYEAAAPNLSGFTAAKADTKAKVIAEKGITANSLELWNGAKWATPQKADAITDAPQSIAGTGLHDARSMASKPILLLDWIEIPRDRLKGDWKLQDGILSTKGGGNNKVRVPIIPPDEYDLSFIVDPASRGSKEFVITLGGANGARFSIAMDAYAQGIHTGISMIDRKPCVENDSHHTGEVLLRDQPNTIAIRVRKQGVRLTVNGKMIFDWEGNSSRLSADKTWEEPTARSIVIGANDSEMSIRNIVLIPRPKIEILNAKFGGGRKWANVTDRIRDIYSGYTGGFRNTPKGLGKDPTPGWKKKTMIRLTIDGQTKTWWLAYERWYDLHHELEVRAKNK